MRLRLIPVSDAVIVIIAPKRRSAVALFNLKTNAPFKSDRIRNVPLVRCRVRFLQIAVGLKKVAYVMPVTARLKNRVQRLLGWVAALPGTCSRAGSPTDSRPRS